MSKQKEKPACAQDVPLGERLRYWRLHLKLTQADIERRAGLAHNALSRIENDHVDPQFDTVMRIAEAMEMSFEEIQQRPIPTDQVGDADESIEDLAAGLQMLPPTKRRHLTRAFLQILKEMED